MRIFPKIPIEVSTLKSTNEVVNALYSNLKGNGGDWDKLLEGNISDSEINVSRTPFPPLYGTGKMPILYGYIIATENGSKLIGEVTFKKSLSRFLSIIYILTIFLITTVTVSGRNDLLPSMLVIAILAIIMGMVSHIIFYREVKNLKELLNSIL